MILAFHGPMIIEVGKVITPDHIEIGGEYLLPQPLKVVREASFTEFRAANAIDFPFEKFNEDFDWSKCKFFEVQTD